MDRAAEAQAVITSHVEGGTVQFFQFISAKDSHCFGQAPNAQCPVRRLRYSGHWCGGPLPCPNRLEPDNYSATKSIQWNVKGIVFTKSPFNCIWIAAWIHLFGWILCGQIIVEDFIVHAVRCRVVSFLFPRHAAFVLIGHVGQLLLAHFHRRWRCGHRQFVVNLTGGIALEMIGQRCTGGGAAAAAAGRTTIDRDIFQCRFDSGIRFRAQSRGLR